MNHIQFVALLSKIFSKGDGEEMKHREKPLLDLRRYSEDAISRDHFVGMKNSEVFPEPPRDWQVYPQQLCPLFRGILQIWFRFTKAVTSVNSVTSTRKNVRVFSPMVSFVIDLQQGSDGALLARYSTFRAFSSVAMVQEIKKWQ